MVLTLNFATRSATNAVPTYSPWDWLAYVDKAAAMAALPETLIVLDVDMMIYLYVDDARMTTAIRAMHT